MYIFKRTVKNNSTDDLLKSNIKTKNVLIYKLLNLVKRLIVPDIWKLTWVPFSVKKAINIIQKNNIKNIVTSSPPHSTQLIGLAIKRELKDKVKWIVDFRDLWSLSHPVLELDHARISKNRHYEKSVLQNADIVVFNTKSGKKIILDSFKINEKEEIHKVIYNGYDEEDFINFKSTDVNGKTENDKVIISYVGSIYGQRINCKYIEAIGYLLKNNKELNTEFHFMGNLDPVTLNKIKALKSNKVIAYGNKSHGEALKLMNNSDILVVIWNNCLEGKVAVSAKIFEYLRMGKIILSFYPNGELTRLINDNKLGESSNPENIDECVKAIKKIIRNVRKNRGFYKHMDNAKLKKYSRQYLTKRLECILLGKKV